MNRSRPVSDSGPPTGHALYDVDGIPVSVNPATDGARAWDTVPPRNFDVSFVWSEGVSVGRRKFQDLRKAAFHERVSESISRQIEENINRVSLVYRRARQ